VKIFTYTHNEKRVISGEDGRARETCETTHTHTIDLHRTMTKIGQMLRQISQMLPLLPFLDKIG
jgi:septation ring formation regulator EzrA